MTHTELKEYIRETVNDDLKANLIIGAVEAYSSASNNGNAIVSGALPHSESPIELIERRFVTADGVIVWDEQFKGLLTNLLGGNDR